MHRWLFALLFLAAPLAAQTPPVQFTGFTSTCVNPGNPRVFTVAFTVTSVPPAQTAQVMAINGTLNGQPTLTVPLVNNQATVTATYTESINSAQADIGLFATILNQNQPVRRGRATFPLVACGNPCGTQTVQMPPPVVGFSQGSLAGFSGPTLGVATGLTAGPLAVAKIEVSTTGAQRRTRCTGAAPGPWTAVGLPPLTAAELGLNASSGYSATTAGATWQYPSPQAFTPGRDLAHTLKLPGTKLQPNCPEEYRFNLIIKVTFANGCTQTQTFNGLTALRP